MKSKHLYLSCTTVVAFVFGYTSYRMRRMRVSMLEMHEQGRDPNFVMHVINDALAVCMGYAAGHLLACDYIYKHR